LEQPGLQLQVLQVQREQREREREHLEHQEHQDPPAPLQEDLIQRREVTEKGI
jgi:hypothetical protein